MPKELTPLEKLQLLVPGYRGYKVKDLIRQDDFLIRQSVISKLENAINNISQQESQLASIEPFSPALKKMEYLQSQLRTIIGIINSQQGSGGDVYARYKIQTEQLDDIVNNDLNMVSIANDILNFSVSADNVDAMLSMIGKLKEIIINRNKLLFPPEAR
ncbi:hypothetical protein [Acidianus sp. HS-5]|uniref:hypothetical protein n=1 Tax=Acidianus sp. HS-5 TaxID=2886040 RepID=UPI001F412C44|nr:hypothetical protein [Acidianus sp. HS-5]BDC17812.1 hypothetical protein HS5_07020 [Acidianus sp. HS-5]